MEKKPVKKVVKKVQKKASKKKTTKKKSGITPGGHSPHPKGSKLSKSKRDVQVDELVNMEVDPSVQRTVNKQGPRNYDQLRLQAMAIYITDAKGISLTDLMQDPRFKGKINMDTMRKWAAADGWSQKRREAVENLKQVLVEKLQQRLTDNLAREVQDLLNLRTQTIHHLQHVPPDKWEGVASILLKLNERLADIAEMAKSGMVDDVGRPIPESERMQHGRAMSHDFDPAQLREAAKSITTKQRGAMRARLSRTRQVNERKRLAAGRSEVRRDLRDEHPEGGLSGEE